MQSSPMLAAVEYGQYVSALKCIPLIIILLIWARLLTWIDKDAEAAHLPRQSLNLGFISGLTVGFALFLFLPNFWVALGGMVAVFAVEIAVYLLLRQQKVGLADLSVQFTNWLKSFGSGKKAAVVKAGQVVLVG